MDYKLEVISLPVSDVDQASAFYMQKAGFDLDVDYHPASHFRVVQLTPPGSACSIQIGVGLTDAATGSARATYLAVTNIEAARRELTKRGVKVSDIRHKSPMDDWKGGWRPGADPETPRLRQPRRLHRPRRQHLDPPVNRLPPPDTPGGGERLA
jgi:hypothetical protein